MRRNESSPYKTLVYYGVAFGALLLAGRGCAEIVEVPESEIKDFIEDSGFDTPVITDVDKSPNPAIAFGCDEGHLIKYEFDAVSSNTGNDFSGIVCDGLFSGKSLRD